MYQYNWVQLRVVCSVRFDTGVTNQSQWHQMSCAGVLLHSSHSKYISLQVQKSTKVVTSVHIDIALTVLVSFTNPLAAGSGLVERTPKKVRFLL